MSRLTESLSIGSTDSLSDRMLDSLPERGSPTWYVLALALALFVGFSIYTALMHARFETTGADLGAYTHMFSSTLDGEGWLQHGKYRASHPSGSYWGAHFSLTLLLFMPLFALVPSDTLLVAKSFVLAASVVVLWLLARDRLDSDRLAGVVTVSYAFNPFLWSAWSFDFQEQVLIPPFLFAAYYCYQKDRRFLFLGFLALVLFTNEFVVFPTIGFIGGLFVAAAIAGRLRKRGPMILGAGVLVVVARVASSAAIDYYSVFGGLPTYVVAEPLQPFIQGMGRVSIVDLAMTVLANPMLLIDSATFAVADKLLFFAAFMLPVAFLALFDELSLAALAPYLGFAWVFTGEAKAVYFEFGAHYPLYLLPFVYIGAIHALRRLSGRFDALRWPSRSTLAGLVSAVLVLCLVSGAASGGGHLAVPPPADDDDHRQTLDTAIDSIPEDASLIAQNDIYPHVATRPNASFIVSPGTFSAYERRWQNVTPEYLLLDTQLNPNAPWARAVQQTYADRLGDEYGLYRYQEGIQIFKRGYDGPVQGVTQSEPGARRYDAASMATGTGERADGTIVSDNGSAGDYLWFGPYDTLTPGSYTATFRVNASGSGSDPVVTVDVAGGDDHGRIASESIAPTDGWRNVTVDFTIDETITDVEFRGIREGSGRIALDGVRVNYESKNATANASAGSA
ncbi:hypothetical protein C448_07487 [Halococcus morrhuae DSM 1307]|uniref:DUF2079 domain-containing protein n=1 Tax=Halococcus morrhuae DSM 1307 TaxID=931277 RepID=M0MJ09_HALMO|nr:DUF2079 domain-containing protein [Halococcus morrhuae]EMA45661.1 hypothetical protein C448_07487 [Halococcus morrhuae DSM 1307]